MCIPQCAPPSSSSPIVYARAYRPPMRRIASIEAVFWWPLWTPRCSSENHSEGRTQRRLFALPGNQVCPQGRRVVIIGRHTFPHCRAERSKGQLQLPDGLGCRSCSCMNRSRMADGARARCASYDLPRAAQSSTRPQRPRIFLLPLATPGFSVRLRTSSCRMAGRPRPPPPRSILILLACCPRCLGDACSRRWATSRTQAAAKECTTMECLEKRGIFNNSRWKVLSTCRDRIGTDESVWPRWPSSDPLGRAQLTSPCPRSPWCSGAKGTRL